MTTINVAFIYLMIADMKYRIDLQARSASGDTIIAEVNWNLPANAVQHLHS